MKKLLIDKEKCIGCGMCTKICFAHHLSLDEEKKCTEEDSLCIQCGQCATICPKEAIAVEWLKDEPSVDMKSLNSRIEPENLRDFLKSRRSCRYFTDKKISRETFEELITFAAQSAPSYWNIQTTEFAILDENLQAFREKLLKVYSKELDGHDYFNLHGEDVDRDDVVRLFSQYMKGEFPFDQFFIGGKQAIAVFAKHPYDAVIATAYIELMAHAMGLGGFWCGFAITAAQRYPEEMMEFFPEIDQSKKLYSVYVIGYPKYKHRRTAAKAPVRITFD